MEHHDHHHHAPSLTHVTRALWIGIVLNSVFVITEFIAGFVTNSLALLSDAGHNLSDVASLGLALFAFKISASKAPDNYTYGYHKSTILVSLVNAVILLIAVGSIGWEAIQRFMYPEPTNGGVVSIVAAIGIVINTVSALFFFKDKEKDINIKGAYLHLAVDAVVSLVVVIGGIIISKTGIMWIDPVISLVIMIVVLFSTWKLLVQSLRLSMDAVPENVNMEKIKTAVLKVEGVQDIHHVHIWGMSTSKNAMTAHLILNDALNEKEIDALKHKVKHELEHQNIQHATLETESASMVCKEPEC